MCVLIPLDFAAISSRLKLADVRRFASSGEIQSYLSHVVDHFDLAHHIEFKTTVTKSAWSEHERKWLVNTERNGIVNKDRKADVLINAARILNHYRYPDIPGLDSYNISGNSWATKTRKARHDPPIHHAVYHRRGTRPTLSISLKGGPSIRRDGFWLHTSTGSRLLGI